MGITTGVFFVVVLCVCVGRGGGGGSQCFRVELSQYLKVFITAPQFAVSISQTTMLVKNS